MSKLLLKDEGVEVQLGGTHFLNVYGRGTITLKGEIRSTTITELRPTNLVSEHEVIKIIGLQQGPGGPRGFSTYELAVQNGYSGTEQEWLESQSPSGQIFELVGDTEKDFRALFRSKLNDPSF